MQTTKLTPAKFVEIRAEAKRGPKVYRTRLASVTLTVHITSAMIIDTL